MTVTQLLRISRKQHTSNYTYSIRNSNIQPTTNAKYLGITINNKLSWNTHIQQVCQKANNTLNFIHRNFKSCNQKTKEKLYKSHVRPIVEYASSVWDPHTLENTKKIERVQKRAARFVKNTFSRDTHITPILKDLNWTPLEERRARSKTCNLYKALHNTLHIPTHNINPTQSRTRNQHNFFIPFAHSDTYKHSFYLDTIRLWNKIPLHITEAPSLLTFQKGLSSLTLRKKY